MGRNNFTGVTLRPPILPIGPSIAYLDLGSGNFGLIDRDDVDAFGRFNWRRSSVGYIARNSVGPEGSDKIIMLHKQIVTSASGMVVDHRNRNRLDNRRANLRICTSVENRLNQGPRRPGRFKGTYSHSSYIGYRGQIKAEGKSYVSTCFSTEEEAARWYDAMARKLHGEFAYQNFPLPPELQKQLDAANGTTEGR